MTPSDISTNAGFRVFFFFSVCHVRIAPAPVSLFFIYVRDCRTPGKTEPENIAVFCLCLPGRDSSAPKGKGGIPSGRNENHGYVRSLWYNKIRCASVGVPAVIILTETSRWGHDEQKVFLADFERGCLLFQAPQHRPIATDSAIERISYVFDPIDLFLVKLVEKFLKFGFYFQQLSDLDRMLIDRSTIQIDPKYFMVRLNWGSTVARHGTLCSLKRLLSLFVVRLSLIFSSQETERISGFRKISEEREFPRFMVLLFQ